MLWVALDEHRERRRAPAPACRVARARAPRGTPAGGPSIGAAGRCDDRNTELSGLPPRSSRVVARRSAARGAASGRRRDASRQLTRIPARPRRRPGMLITGRRVSTPAGAGGSTSGLDSAAAGRAADRERARLSHEMEHGTPRVSGTREATSTSTKPSSSMWAPRRDLLPTAPLPDTHRRAARLSTSASRSCARRFAASASQSARRLSSSRACSRSCRSACLHRHARARRRRAHLPRGAAASGDGARPRAASRRADGRDDLRTRRSYERPPAWSTKRRSAEHAIARNFRVARVPPARTARGRRAPRAHDGSASRRPFAAVSGSRCAPPPGSGTTSSTTPNDCASVRQHAQRLRGLGSARAVTPEDRRAALRRDHRVRRVLHHEDAVGDAERERPAGSALADHRPRRSARAAATWSAATDRIASL